MFVFRNCEIPLNKNLKNGLSLIFGLGRFKSEIISARLVLPLILKLVIWMFIIDF